MTSTIKFIDNKRPISVKTHLAGPNVKVDYTFWSAKNQPTDVYTHLDYVASENSPLADENTQPKRQGISLSTAEWFWVAEHAQKLTRDILNKTCGSLDVKAQIGSSLKYLVVEREGSYAMTYFALQRQQKAEDGNTYALVGGRFCGLRLTRNQWCEFLKHITEISENVNTKLGQRLARMAPAKPLAAATSGPISSPIPSFDLTAMEDDLYSIAVRMLFQKAEMGWDGQAMSQVAYLDPTAPKFVSVVRQFLDHTVTPRTVIGKIVETADLLRKFVGVPIDVLVDEAVIALNRPTADFARDVSAALIKEEKDIYSLLDEQRPPSAALADTFSPGLTERDMKSPTPASPTTPKKIPVIDLVTPPSPKRLRLIVNEAETPEEPSSQSDPPIAAAALEVAGNLAHAEGLAGIYNAPEL